MQECYYYPASQLLKQPDNIIEIYPPITVEIKGGHQLPGLLIEVLDAQVQGLHRPQACFVDNTEEGFFTHRDQGRGAERLAFLHGQASIDHRGCCDEFVPISTFEL